MINRNVYLEMNKNALQQGVKLMCLVFGYFERVHPLVEILSGDRISNAYPH